MADSRKSRRPSGSRSIRPKASGRAEPILRGDSVEALRMRVITLEAELDRERKERSEEAGMFAKMLLKVTEAEEEARTLRERAVELQNALGGKGPAESLLSRQLKEMRTLLGHAADVFDDLDRREQAVSEFRSRGLQEVRGALLRAAGRTATRSLVTEADEDADAASMIEIVESLRPQSK